MRSLVPFAALLALSACASPGTSPAGPAASASASAVVPASGEPAASGAPSGAAAAVSGAPTGAVPAASSGGAQAAAGPSGECATPCFSIEKCEGGQCVPACPPGEVYIPRTPESGFTLGRGKVPYGFGKRGGRPADGIADAPHNVVLTKPFCMDATEVTVRAMLKCIQEQGCREPSKWDVWATYPKKLDYPVNMADWDTADEFCKKQGQSLPTEAQWEWAATGGDHRDWPWGNEPPPDCEHTDYTSADLPSPGGDAGCHGGGPSAVGTHTKGDKIWPTGAIHDLAGNVWEWMLDNYARYPAESQVDPLYYKEGVLTHMVRGGGWNRSHLGITTWFRGAAIHTYKVPGLGFRCVRNPK